MLCDVTLKQSKLKVEQTSLEVQHEGLTTK